MKCLKSLLCSSAAAVIMMAVPLPCPAWAQMTSEMTVEAAVDLAIARSPEIKISDAQTQQATHSTDEARAGYYPQLDLSARGGREYNNPSSSRGSTIATGRSDINTSAQTALTLRQNLYNGFQTQEEVLRLKQLEESAQIQTVRVQEQIALRTIEAYLKILQSQQAAADAALFLQTMQEIMDKLVLMVEVGAESDAKLKFVDARIQNARQQKIAIESDLSDALNDLELLIGPAPPFEALHPLAGFTLEDIEHYHARAEAKNRELEVNKSDRQALMHQLEGVKGRSYPTLDAVVEVSQSHDVGGEVGRDRGASGMLQMNYNIFDGFARDAAQKRVLSQISELDITIEQITRDIRQKIKLLYNQVQSLENEWYSVEQEITANDALRVLNQEQFELGEANILELVESEERYFDSKIKKYQLEFDFVFAIYALFQETGALDEMVPVQTSLTLKEDDKSASSEP